LRAPRSRDTIKVEISGAASMSDDPRWQEAISLFERLRAPEGAPADKSFVGGFQQLIATLEAIAADRAVASAERATAQKILAQMMTSAIRARTPELVRKAAEMAGDAALSPEIRADMRRLLGDITERMPAASDKVQ
jgi:hypothetical protein